MSDSTTLATEISSAVETALANEKASAATVTADQATSEAQAIYYAWRNKNLQTMAPDAFRIVEAASGDLIAAIAAKLTSNS